MFSTLKMQHSPRKTARIFFRLAKKRFRRNDQCRDSKVALRENPPEKEIGSDKGISNGRWASRGTPYKANLESRSLCLSVQADIKRESEVAAPRRLAAAGFRLKKRATRCFREERKKREKTWDRGVDRTWYQYQKDRHSNFCAFKFKISEFLDLIYYQISSVIELLYSYISTSIKCYLISRAVIMLLSRKGCRIAN